MTTTTLFILCTGLLAMAGSLGVAWWIWTHDPIWPWTMQESRPRPTGSNVRINSPASPYANHVAALEPLPAPDTGERAATMLFVKGKTPDKTEILTDRHQLLELERDADAPVAYEDQLQTTPNPRAGPTALHPNPPRR